MLYIYVKTSLKKYLKTHGVIIMLLLISKLITQLIHIYQIFISPLIKPHCRFQITCSEYGINAINNFGPLKGIWMLLIRILKCHPFEFTNIKKLVHNIIKNTNKKNKD